MRVLTALFVTMLAALCFASASAEQKAEVVLDGLDNPCGVAIQPGTGHVFLSDSGAGRVIRVVDGKAQDVITGFPQDIYGKGPKYNIGPLGLAFLDKNTLVVGGGGNKDVDELVRVYTVPKAGSAAIKAEDMKVKLGPLTASEELKAEGNFYGVAATKTAIYVTCNGDDAKGWVSKISLSGTKLGKLQRFISTKEAVEVDAPVAITISKRGEIVVGQMGEITLPRDSLLTFYSSQGKKLLNLQTGLYDITALAYSPKGQLVALDFAWMDTAKGGLFHLVEALDKTGRQALKSNKIASLDKPTAMAFGRDGTLYITVIGTAKEGESKPGKLLRLAPGL